MKTRIKYTMLFAALFLLKNSFAQSSDESEIFKKVSFGFKIAPSINWVKPTTGNIKNDGSTIGFSYGLLMDYNFSKNYALATELNLTSMKNKITMVDSLADDKGTYLNGRYAYKLQYLQIPLTIKMKTKLDDEEKMKLFFKFGFAPSFLIKNNVTFSADNEKDRVYSPNSDDENDFSGVGANNEGAFKDNVSLFRIPMVIGAGIEVAVSDNARVFGELRFDNSFTDMFRDKNTKAINNFMALNLGVYF